MNIQIIPATMKDYPIVQNMARFYVYDMSRYCGFDAKDWGMPDDGLYECINLKDYFENPNKKAFLLRIKNELGGFVLLDRNGKSPNLDWNMGEFFITSRFQSKGIGEYVAREIWKLHPGLWEVSVIPENAPALRFWRKIISNFTNNNFREEIKTIDYDKHQPNRYILSFDTNKS